MNPKERPIEETIEELSATATSTPPIYQRDNDGEFIVRPSLIERLLSPQSLQWMMLVGGGMLVIGFVVWLWSIGLFENPVVVALVMGGAIGGVIAGGIALVKFTRYQLAGHGITLLGAMAMPLQLWFYHAQDLINLNDGGHLWIPAAVFCLVYAGIARVLRSSAFVYTLVGGVVLTGMLLMADQAVNQFWNLLPQVTFLVGLGWLCVFSERWFVDTDSDFSRNKFGRSFRRAGTVTIIGGLAMLMISQVSGLFFDELVFNGYAFAQFIPSLAQQCWAIGILCVTAIGLALGNLEEGESVLSGKRNGLLGLLIWIVVCVMGALNVTITATTVATILAVAVIGFNFYQKLVSKLTTENKRLGSFAGLATTTSLVLCFLAMAQFCLQFTTYGGGLFISQLGFASLAQIALASLAAMSCSFIANEQEQSDNQTRVMMAFNGGLTAVAAIWTGMCVMQAFTLLPLIVIGLGFPLVTAAMGVVLEAPQSRLLKFIAATMAIAHMLLLVPYCNFNVQPSELSWIAIFSVTALVHYLCSFIQADQANQANQAKVRIGFNRLVTYGYLTATVSIGLSLLGMSLGLAIVSAPAIVGLLLMVVGRMVGGSLGEGAIEKAQWSLVADYGRVFIMFANVAAMLFALNMVLVGETSVSLAVAVGLQLVTAVIAVFLSKAEGWKNGFIASSIVLTVTQLMVVNAAIPFTIATKVEFAAVLVGVLLLAIGHVSWAKEETSASGSTTAALWLGSMLTSLPLLAALFIYRYANVVGVTGSAQYGHEIAVLVTLFTLVAAGILCRIRSTTIVGAFGMIVYVASLLTMIPLPEKLQSISVVMMAGGAIFFSTAILLSVYRDRIIAIPNRFRNGDGVFQVLKWR